MKTLLIMLSALFAGCASYPADGAAETSSADIRNEAVYVSIADQSVRVEFFYGPDGRLNLGLDDIYLGEENCTTEAAYRCTKFDVFAEFIIPENYDAAIAILNDDRRANDAGFIVRELEAETCFPDAFSGIFETRFNGIDTLDETNLVYQYSSCYGLFAFGFYYPEEAIDAKRNFFLPQKLSKLVKF